MAARPMKISGKWLQTKSIQLAELSGEKKVEFKYQSLRSRKVQVVYLKMNSYLKGLHSQNQNKWNSQSNNSPPIPK